MHDGRRDDSYCGRGYEQWSRDGRGYGERPRYSNGRGYDDDYRYERPRADDRDYHEQQSPRYEEGRGSEGRGYDKRSHYSDFRGYDQGHPYSEMPEWKCTEVSNGVAAKALAAMWHGMASEFVVSGGECSEK